MFGEDDIVRSHKTRADIIANIVVICFVIILARLWYLQIHKGSEFKKFSIENRLRKEIDQAPRGLIFSRNNQILVRNSLRFDAIITPQYLKDKKKTIKHLSKLIEMPESDIIKILKKNSYQAKYRPVTIKKNIEKKEVALIETQNAFLPGVSVKTFISREYPDHEVGAHILGYISEISQTQLPKYKKRDKVNYRLGDFIGQAGVEQEFDKKLRGEDGYQFMEVDASGRVKRIVKNNNLFAGIRNKESKSGNNIRLTIDRDMQHAAYKALEGKVGSATAIDIHTGEILAMVSRPSFLPGEFSKGVSSEYWSSIRDNIHRPLRARAIQEHYAPGSTFKAIAALAALEEGIIDEHTTVKCPGYFYIGKHKKHCWRKYGHGKVDVVRSLRESCDVFYYKIATMMDIDVLAKYARKFGMGQLTGVSLPRETPGLFPTKEWKRKRFGKPWQKGETLSCIIGQSYVLSTPLQLSLAFAAFANGGKIYRPYLLKEIFDNSGEISEKGRPELVSEVTFKKKNIDLIKKGLFEVVNSPKGTAFWQKGYGIRMAGKTGTSQVIRFSASQIFSKCSEKEFKFRHHGVFAAYAPVEDPQIAISVVVEHGCSGSSAAGPVAKEIATAYMKKYQPEKHKIWAKEDIAYIRNYVRERNKRREELEREQAQEDEADVSNQDGQSPDTI